MLAKQESYLSTMFVKNDMIAKGVWENDGSFIINFDMDWHSWIHHNIIIIAVLPTMKKFKGKGCSKANFRIRI